MTSQRITVWPDGLDGPAVPLEMGRVAWTEGWPEDHEHPPRPSRTVEEVDDFHAHGGRRVFRVHRDDGTVFVRPVSGPGGEMSLTTADVARAMAADLLAVASHLDATEGHLRPLVQTVEQSLRRQVRDPARRRVAAEDIAARQHATVKPEETS